MPETDSPPPKDRPDAQLTENDRQRIALEEALKSLSKPTRLRKYSRWVLAIVAASEIGTAVWIKIFDSFTDSWFLLLLPAGLLLYYWIAVLTRPFIRGFLRTIYERRLKTLGVTRSTEELQDKLEENFFTNLVKINFKYIDQYYLQTQLQADKSFFLCAAAALVSLVVILSGIVHAVCSPVGKGCRICCHGLRNPRRVYLCSVLLSVQSNHH